MSNLAEMKIGRVEGGGMTKLRRYFQELLRFSECTVFAAQAPIRGRRSDVHAERTTGR